MRSGMRSQCFTQKSRRRICKILGGLWWTFSCSASKPHTAAHFLHRPFPGWVYGQRGRQQLSAKWHGSQDPVGAMTLGGAICPMRNKLEPP